jgi:transcriptional regulator with XRE-family HTH domain
MLSRVGKIEMDIYAQIGERIRTAREKQAITQEELGKRIGKTKTAVSSYEHGKRMVSVGDLPELANALKVSINYFFGEEMIQNDEEEVPPEVQVILKDLQPFLIAFTNSDHKTTTVEIKIIKRDEPIFLSTSAEASKEDNLDKPPSYDFSVTFVNWKQNSEQKPKP